jgi:hypothetical protein
VVNAQNAGRKSRTPEAVMLLKGSVPGFTYPLVRRPDAKL